MKIYCDSFSMKVVQVGEQIRIREKNPTDVMEVCFHFAF